MQLSILEWVALGVAVTLGGLLVVEKLENAALGVELNAEKVGREADRVDAEQLLQSTIRDYRARETTLTQRNAESEKSYQAHIETLVADVAALRNARDGLRDTIASLTDAARRNPGPNPAPAGSGPTAAEAADLLADMLRGLDDASESLAVFADRSFAAGQFCERSYDNARETLNEKAPTEDAPR